MVVSVVPVCRPVVRSEHVETVWREAVLLVSFNCGGSEGRLAEANVASYEAEVGGGRLL